MKLPICKEQKCLLYSSCVTKKQIKCEILSKYFRQYYHKNPSKQKKIWSKILQVLPQLEHIQMCKLAGIWYPPADRF